MRILYSSADIHDAIKDVLGAPSIGDRRVALVAYVGEDAEAFLPYVDGLEIVCSLQPGATSAPALQRLQSHGARIYQAKNLHMKVYWSQRRGAVICSANASRHALGRAALKEAGVWLSPGEVDIERLRRYANPQQITAADLQTLGRESDKLAAAIGRSSAMPATPTFGYTEWYMMAGRRSWKLGWWTDDDLSTAASSKAQAKSMYGRTEPANLINAAKGRIQSGDWLLCFKLPEGRKAEWMYIDFVAKVSRSEKGAYEQDYPYQAVQVHDLKRYPAPPFKLDRAFRDALASAVTDLGDDSIMAIDWLHPPARMLDMIASSMGAHVA